MIRWLSPKSSPSLHANSTRLGAILVALTMVSIVIWFLSSSSTPNDNAGVPREPRGFNQEDELERAASTVTASNKRVSRLWVESFASNGEETPTDLLRSLRPLSTRSLLRSLSVNSGTKSFSELHREQRSRSTTDVQAIHVDDSAEDELVVVVVYEQATLARANKASELRTITLGLKQVGSRWLVDEVLVP